MHNDPESPNEPKYLRITVDDDLVQAITDLKVGHALDRVWWLLMSAALLGVMARAFKRI
jgi:hypothetical protein